jgi:hypothetical protein
LHRRDNKDDGSKPFGAAVLSGERSVQVLAGAFVARKVNAPQFDRFRELCVSGLASAVSLCLNRLQA